MSTRVRGSRRAWSLLNVSGLIVGSLIAASIPAGGVEAVSDYVSLSTSARLVDTRPGSPTSDGQQAGIGQRAAMTTLDVQVAGRAGIPIDADVAVLTVTAVDPVDNAYLTVHPTGTPRPNASNVNYNTAHNTANTVIAKLGTDGHISIYTHAATHLIVDVSGYFPIGTDAAIQSSRRLVDTRPGAPTSDGQQAGIGQRAAMTTLDVQVAGRAGIPIDADVAVLTVTAVDPVDNAYLTVHPTGTPRPNASNVNYNTAHNTANTVIAKLGTDGHISIYTHAATHLIVDVSGVLPASVYTPMPSPARLADTREGGTTVDGQQAGTGEVLGGHSLQLGVAGRAGVPADASTAVLTVAAVDPLDNSFLTVHANGTPRPNASNVNYNTAHNMANTVLARIGAGGDVCIFTDATTDLIVDVAGYITGPPPPAAGPICPQPQDIAYLSNDELWLMDADGANERPLITNLIFLGNPDWSADGTMLAFTGVDPADIGQPTFDIEVWTANADGTGQQQITKLAGDDAFSVSWSPDGTQLAYVTTDWDIWIINADGTGNHRILNDPGQQEFVDWSPDGSLLVFNENEVVGNLLTGMARIRTIEPDGDNPTSLTDPGNVNNPKWSPDGSEIAFATFVVPAQPVDDYSDVWIMDADGSNQHNVSNDPTRFDQSPGWSPDADEIVFESAGPFRPVIGPGGEFLGVAHDPPADIYTMPTTGGSKTQLTDLDRSNYAPTWRPPVVD